MQSVTNCDSTVCTFSQLVCCAFVHLMAQFVLMHPASWGERAHTKNVCQTLAPKCWHICATRLWAFSLAHLFRVAQLCKEPTQKTFQWKAEVVLLHRCEELLRAHHVCCTSVCFFIYFVLHVCVHTVHKALLQRAHPVCCTGLNKLNAGNASVLLTHRAVRIPALEREETNSQAWRCDRYPWK